MDIDGYIFIDTPNSQPPKPASLRNVGFAAPCGGAGMWLHLARLWLSEPPPPQMTPNELTRSFMLIQNLA